MNTLRVAHLTATARSRLATVTLKAPLLQAARLLSHTHIGLVVVCQPDGTLAGVVSQTDVLQQIGRCAGQACQTLACDLMTTDAVCCRPDEWLADVLARMEQRGLVHVPVLDDDRRPIGVVNARDALRALVQAGEYEETLLRQYVMGIGYH